MKKFICKFALAFVFSSVLCPVMAQNSDGDDIFKNQKIEADDFYAISVEPSKKALQEKINSHMEKTKSQKLDIIRIREEKQRQIDSKKGELNTKIQNAHAKMQESIEKKKAELNGKKEKINSKKNKDQSEEINEVQNENIQKKQSLQKPVVAAQTVKEAEKEMNEVISDRTRFIDKAMSLKGIPYVWGGKTPVPGLDCSGLVTYAAEKSLGFDLSGNAQMIYDKVKPISIDQAIPGDLIFFKGARDSRITHIGIFLGSNPDGNDFGSQNIFLNAASAGPRTGVIISGMNEKYWKKNYYGAGRFLKDIGD
ncbi:MAG: C40 family peptidase [Treponema sp.]|nr:C40 family peptidase [Candidatus Treponema equifaecale]